jgi:flavin reductase
MTLMDANSEICLRQIPDTARGNLNQADRTVSLSLQESVSRDDFRSVMRQVISSVAIVTAGSGEVRNGLTATAICSVSVDPPTMLVCVNQQATADQLISETGAFAVNYLAEDQDDIARLFSTPKLSADQRFAQGRWEPLVTGALVLSNAVAAFDCMVQEKIAFGTHHIFIGRVLAAISRDKHALLYRDGSFRKIADVA